VNGDGVKECLIGSETLTQTQPIVIAVYTITKNKVKPVKILPVNSDGMYAFLTLTRKKDICTFQEVGDEYVTFERGHLKSGRSIKEQSKKITNTQTCQLPATEVAGLLSAGPRLMSAHLC
jgi:hypothetical protein